ncbi:DUF2789 domain-containing protein [Rheinheimera sp.]|uniref:DUF2789 domain-containing protein n=1 Tax=Rheinheimera sp. TaxID=1869214 RepID=UPI00307F9573
MHQINHDLPSLFAQLGLDNSEQSMRNFIEHHKLAPDLAIERAPFWDQSQAAFLAEQLKADADWSEIIDELSVLLR